MTIDIRAKVFCDKGPVISGGFSDDHVQGTGLIRTRGEVVLDGLVSLRPGDQIRLGYSKGNRVVRIPRALRVLSSFADPFRRQTTVSVGCKLTMLENLRESVTKLAAEDDSNEGIPCEEFGKIPINITFSYIAGQCLSALGITLRGSLGLVGSVAVDSFDFGAGYVSLLSDILYSQSKVGYLDASEQLVVVDLSQTTGTSPVFDEDDLIDVSPIRSGDIPPNVVLVEYSYNRFKKPDQDEADDEDQRQKRDWELDVTQGEAEYHYISFNGGDSLYEAVHYPLSTSLTTYDSLDRVIRREERRTTLGVGINSAYVTELLEETGGLRSNTGLSEETTVTEFIYEYDANDLIVPPENLPPCAYWYYVGTSTLYNEERDQNQIAQVVTTTASDLAIAGRIGFQTYFYPDGELHPGNADFPVEVKRIEFETDKESGITKSKTFRQTCYAMTQAGQQGLSKMADDIDEVNKAFALLFIGAQMVNTGVSVETHYDRYYGLQKRPSLQDRKKKEYYKDPRESVSANEFILGTQGVGITTTYSMPWAPDDRIGYQAGSADPYLVEESIAPELARKFGRVQQRLTYGHRMGFAVQLVPSKLPPYAASLATLQLGGINAQYMVNGQSWTFDANGIVANVDMIYLGGIGATAEEYRVPSPWAPVQDGISQLPLAPATTTNITPTPANSIEEPSGFDPSSPGNIFDTLPTTTEPVYEKEITTEVLVPPYQEVVINEMNVFTRADVTRTLIFLPLADRDVSAGVTVGNAAERFIYDTRDAAPTLRVGASSQVFVYEVRDAAPTLLVGNETSKDVSFLPVAGDATPIAGSSVAASTPSGWTEIYSGNVDDTPLEVTGMPFTFTFNGVGYTSFWLSPNGYITFGSGSSEYTGLGNTNPALPKIFINAMDDSMQKVYVRSTDNTFRVRIEGNTNTSGTGTSYRVHEVAFFNPAGFDGVMVFEIRMGVMPQTTGLFNVYSSNALLSTDTATPAADKSWVFFSPDATGTEWFIIPAFNVTPVE